MSSRKFADVQRLVSSYELTPLYGRREAARSLVQTIGEINDKARARFLHEKFEEEDFKRKDNANTAKVPPAR